jgi:predicted ferric reductase
MPLSIQKGGIKKMLSKKYYVEIARILRENNGKEEITAKLAAYFAFDNPRFSWLKWSKAVNGEKRN